VVWARHIPSGHLCVSRASIVPVASQRSHIRHLLLSIRAGGAAHVLNAVARARQPLNHSICCSDVSTPRRISAGRVVPRQLHYYLVRACLRTTPATFHSQRLPVCCHGTDMGKPLHPDLMLLYPCPPNQLPKLPLAQLPSHMALPLTHTPLHKFRASSPWPLLSLFPGSTPWITLFLHSPVPFLHLSCQHRSFHRRSRTPHLPPPQCRPNTDPRVNSAPRNALDAPTVSTSLNEDEWAYHSRLPRP
jgi:hypothetical protein